MVTLGGIVHVRPAEDVADSMTVPVNPLTGATVMVEVPEAPASIWAGVTVPAAIVKSTTWNVIAGVVRVRVPSVPVTVTE
jgi:hypothetical protein